MKTDWRGLIALIPSLSHTLYKYCLYKHLQLINTLNDFLHFQKYMYIWWVPKSVYLDPLIYIS